MYDAIIIGAGMSGLAAGIRLAHYNRRVCILERHTTIGGLNSFYRLDGRDYDVGLHAVTNFAPRGAKRGPLAQLLRQLRFSWNDWQLCPQRGSQICFPGATLNFSNDPAWFESQIAERFPRQIDGFRRLVADLADYDQLPTAAQRTSARAVVGEYLSDPLLIEMLFCPVLYYGGAREHDADWGQFSIMFRSIFLEGFARPYEGIRLILKLLTRRFKELGGELRLRCGASKIRVRDDAAAALELDDGSELQARTILSSAGWAETMRLCDDAPPVEAAAIGQLSFFETVSTLNVEPAALGFDRTVVFFNDSDTFHWRRPDDLVDPRSGVICSPNNFLFDRPLAEGSIRVTALANYPLWKQLSEPVYRQAKTAWYDRLVESAIRFIPDFRGAVRAIDTFSPTTIRRFTGHENGAVYGAAVKRYDGKTHLKNLFLCGTDQGLVGIIGSIVSGITMANRYVLHDARSEAAPTVLTPDV